MQVADYFDPGLQRALAEAAEKGRVDAIDQLLKNGASVNYKGKEGMTALIWALLKQNNKGYLHLLDNGADPNLQMTESTLTSDGLTGGNSAMSLAAMHEDSWYLDVTLKHGGNPNIINPIKGMPVIFQCIMFLDNSHPKPRLEQLKLLIGAGADLNVRNRSDFTPLMYAVRINRHDMAYIMLQHGADPRLVTRSGTTMIYDLKKAPTNPKSELYQWRTKVIELLAQMGIDVKGGITERDKRTQWAVPYPMGLAEGVRS